MNRSSRSRLQSRRRGASLAVESLESRRLLAGETFDLLQRSDSSNAAWPDQASQVYAADVGIQQTTNHDLGKVDGNRFVSGKLDRTDNYDIIKFGIDSSARVHLTLSNLQQNVDLVLTSDSGKLIAFSGKSGRQVDQISQKLDAGDYSVVVFARSTESTTYRLWVSTEVEKPPVQAKPNPPSQPAPTKPTPAQPTPAQPAPNTPTPTQPAPVTRLPDVANVGGSRQWGLNAIGAPEAWARGYTGRGVTVAVVDTGVDLDHPDLVHSIYVNPGELAGNGIDDDRNGYIDDVHGYDFADRDAVANDTHGHGTHVAGTIAAAHNGVGATGVAPDATIIPVRVLGNGSGQASDVAAGIRYAAKLGADIINLSLGGGYSSAIGSAIDYARSLGSLIVAAAGNEGASAPNYPARFSGTDANVISVGAYASSGTKAGFSNRVGNSRAIQIDAPGVGIYSTYRNGRYATMSGTSMAAPHVSGLAALTLSANPNLTSAGLRQLLAARTEGSARNSDSAGKASAQVTVAYAAAGITLRHSNNRSADSGGSTSSSQFQIRMVDGAAAIVAESSDTQNAISTMSASGIDVLSAQIPNDGSAERVANITAPAGSRKSPVDLYFEDSASEESRHFDTLIPSIMDDFA
jgi:subtilisin family serine protease